MAEVKEAKGTAWLAEYVNDSAGTDYDGYQIRILLRKLAKDEVIVREEGRYTFVGPNDPTVKAVLKYVKSGGAEKANKERLDELKKKRTAKKATAAPVEDEEEEEETPARAARARGRATKKTAATATTSARKRTRKAPIVEAEEEDEDLDIDEI
jgi:hypothetical protein